MIRSLVVAPSRPVTMPVLWALIASAVAALFAMSQAAPAAAQIYSPGSDYDAPRYKPRTLKRRPANKPRLSRSTDDVAIVPPAGADKSKGKDAAAKTADVKTSPKGPLFVVISIADQQITIYNHDGVVTRSRVSTGMAGHPTPKGVYTIIGRERYHYSNIYGGAPMPFMQRVTWSGVAMHLGVVPGYPASHGCIRLPGGFAAHLWGLTKIGERIVIARHDVKPAAFEHAALPVPKMQSAPADTETASIGTATAVHHLAQVATVSGDISPAAEPAAASAGMLNPLQYAEHVKTKAAAEAATASKAAQDALAIASVKKAEAARASSAVVVAEKAFTAAEAKAAAAVAAVEKAAPNAREAAEIASWNAEATAVSAMSKLAAVREIAEAKDAEWAQKTNIWRDATAAADAARSASRAASKRASPVSVLVSKKDQRVYVRQGLAPLLDAPASVRDPDQPLGTHLYIATAAAEDSASLKWTTLTMPAASAEPDNARKKSKWSRETPAAVPAQSGRAASSAAEALERIDIPAEVRERISELLWTGGSMIISDQPLSSETSDVGTDLVVKVR